MLQCKAGILFFLSLGLFAALPFRASVAQGLSYRLGAEGGWSRSAFSSLLTRSSPVVRLNGRVKYGGKSRRNSWFLQARFRPDIFLTDDLPTFSRFSLQGSFLQKFRAARWRFTAAHERQQISAFNSDIVIGISQIGSQASWSFHRSNALQFSLDFVHRTVNDPLDSRLNAVLTRLALQRAFSSSTTFAAGLYLEKFKIQQRSAGFSAQNDGWRYGPEISLAYKHRIVLSGNYRFLWHQSDVTTAPSHEQWVRLLFGKILLPQWSLFFLTDYFFRDYSIRGNAPVALVFAPLDTENRVYLKIERDISAAITTFFRIGFLSENFIATEQSLSGWRSTLGVEIKK